jgi:hypothetical protein
VGETLPEEGGAPARDTVGSGHLVSRQLPVAGHPYRLAPTICRHDHGLWMITAAMFSAGTGVVDDWELA